MHIQIDNMFARRSEYKVMFSPTQVLDKQLIDDEKNLEFEDKTFKPFIAVELDKSDTDTIKDDKKEEATEAGSIETWRTLSVQIGEMELKLHKQTLLGLLVLVNRIVSALSGFTVEEITQFKSVEAICPLLDTSQLELSLDPKNTSTKIYFEKVYFSKVKVRISFKMGKQEGSIQLNPAKGFGAF